MASRGGKQPKTMSSALANMKFMQRANKSTPQSPNTPTEPPAKKVRLPNGSAMGAPASPAEASPTTESYSGPDLSRSEKWYLSYKAPETKVAQSPLRIVSAGYAALDAAGRAEEEKAVKKETEEDGEDEEEESNATGRMKFGNFNRKSEKQQNPDLEGDSDDSDEEDKSEDGEISDDPTGVKALIAQGRKDATERARTERKAKKKAEGAEAARMAEQRRKKDLNLNRPSESDSPFGKARGGSRPNLTNVECHRCGNKGHMAKDCPEKTGQRRGGSDRRPRY